MPDWQVKLADFGHSKVVDDFFVRSSSVGTPLYMAPEAFELEAPFVATRRFEESEIERVDSQATGH